MSARFYDFRKRVAPRPAAAALQYDPVGTAPPQVVAAGSGPLAETIVAVAREHGVPVREDTALVEALARLEIGSVIPHELYAVVAEVLAYVYLQDERARKDA